MISADAAAAAAAWLQRILVLGLALFLGIGLWAAAKLLRMLLLGLAFMIGCHLWFLCLLIDSLRIIAAAAAAGAFAAAAATCRAVAALTCIRTITGFRPFTHKILFSGLRLHFLGPVWLLSLHPSTSNRHIRRQSLQGFVRLKGSAKSTHKTSPPDT